MFRQLLTPAFAAVFLAFVAARRWPQSQLPLITAEEAALPPHKGGGSELGTRHHPRSQNSGIGSGSAAHPSPMRFHVKFQTFGGSNIDLDALKVTYLKSPVVDLTSRIKPFVQADRD